MRRRILNSFPITSETLKRGTVNKNSQLPYCTFKEVRHSLFLTALEGLVQMCDHTVCNTDVVLLKSLKKNHQKDQPANKKTNGRKKKKKVI